MTAKRQAEGGLINREKTIHFTFNGKEFQGFEGDSLASALLAADQLLMGRSFKYHRPRGLLSAGAEEPNGLVQLEEGAYSSPNTRATQIELYPDLKAKAQNVWPSLDFDAGEINNWLAKLFPAGFYYKTFMWPASLWMTYEKVIRRIAGLGKAPVGDDPEHYDHLYSHCDLVIVGAGPAGLAAALTAGKAGLDVRLIEQDSTLGGALLGQSEDLLINKKSALHWVAKVRAELEELPNVQIMTRTVLTGYFDDNYLTALEQLHDHLPLAARGKGVRQRLHKIRAQEVVLATGALERPLTFDNNDLPGVMLASAVQTYLHRYAVLPGQSIIVGTNNDSGYSVACDLHQKGAGVVVVDTRPAPPPGWAETMADLGVTVFSGSAVIAACGKKRVTGVKIARLSSDGTKLDGPIIRMDGDLVAMSGGWNPTVHLHSQARGKLLWREDLAAFVIDKATALGHQTAGAINGSFALKDCLAEGHKCALEIAKKLGKQAPSPRMSLSPEAPVLPIRTVWSIPGERPLGEGKAKQFVDFQNDVTAADIMLAEREGYQSVEHLKRYTTTGMGTDQGKTSNVISLALMAGKRGLSVPEVGTTTFRPPYTPLTFGALAGQMRGETFIPIRNTPIHEAEVALKAEFECVGDWMRAYYYPKDGENKAEAVSRECLAVRESVGMFDASTLGKIDIQGKDAAAFLNLIYTNAWLKLGVGRCRYGLMLNEHGMVFDDGVTTRLGETHFHMTTTTGGAARVLTWMDEWLQTEWPDLEVYCTSVTEAWAVIALSGPKSRELLGKLTTIDLSAEAFPFMSMQEAEVGGIPARIFRISFNGEIAYEINVPSRFGRALWDKIAEAGAPLGVTPYGTETMHVLRAEKGFIIAGQDTDGTTTPYDLGMDWIVNKKKGEFLGRRSLTRSDTAAKGRKQLVGLLPERKDFIMPRGLHLVERGTPTKPPFEHLGHVSSTYHSPTLGRAIGFGLIKDGFARKGETLMGRTLDGKEERITVTDPVFIDPEGGRARG